MMASTSMTLRPNCAATRGATVLFPEPIMPMRVMCLAML